MQSTDITENLAIHPLNPIGLLKTVQFIITHDLFSGYLIAFLINVYPVTQTDIHIYVSTLPFGTCLYNPKYTGLFPTFHAVLGVYLPMGVIGACYVTVFLTVKVKEWRSRRGRRALAPGTMQTDVLLRKRTGLARMLFVSFLWNALTYLPQPVLSAFMPDVYCHQPTSFFYVRWILQLGVAGNTVCVLFFSFWYLIICFTVNLVL